jgi:hypothetical protein
MLQRKFALVALAACARVLPATSATTEFADSDELTNMWSAISSKQIDRLFDTLVAKHDNALQRSADGRGPLFWAYEFKSPDALALLKSLGVDEDAQDLDGKAPTDFFDGDADDLDAFRASAGAISDDVLARFAEKEEDHASLDVEYDDDDDDDDEAMGGGRAAPAVKDEIDYADDEDDDDLIDDKDEV